VQGLLSNGAFNAVTITRSSGAGASIALSASPATVSGGQTSVITATVTGGTNSGANETVTLTIPVNNSGASFINASGASVSTVTVTTGSGGTASAIFRAGTNNSGAAVQDTVQGILSNGALNSVVITRSSGAGASIALSASPATVSGGQTSVITATVTGGTNSGANEAVTLTIPVNNSGASFINASGASVSTVTITTGSGGNASAIYRSGTNFTGTSVQDTVQGLLSNGAFNAVTITVRSTGVTGYVVTVTANPTTLTTPSGSSIVTANVRDNAGIAIVGITITFSKTGAAGGLQPSPASATTDANGNAITVFTGAAPSGTAIVQANTTIGGVIYAGAVAITVP
jgi:hypothetical protein